MNYEELQQGIEDNLPIPNWDELWEAIEKGDLEKYTPKQIEEGMLQENQGWKLYQDAAMRGYLGQIPKELLTEENLLKLDGWGSTCLHWAALNGQLDKIPKEILTAENLLDPKEMLTLENLLKDDPDSWTCLHLAARHGHLDQIPRELLTEENLLQPTKKGDNSLHLAASRGHLNQIPREILTAKNLLQPNYNKDTCLHWAAKKGHLDKIPLSYETLKELTAYFETEDSSEHNELILKTLNELLKKKIKKLEIIARSQTINHDTDIL
jgi:ankyrin repeat protein